MYGQGIYIQIAQKWIESDRSFLWL
jgi:hypothetical protein